MKAKLFKKDIPRRCEYCLFSREFDSTTEVLCSKRGVTAKGDSCRKYRYDVTKRIPQKTVLAGDYKSEDFII
ncbi:MAG: hypothetical protein E7550_06390 [Ruminococcaceae bacterium]|nr:hypothetical protein [Oscillospiraceae bacterium]